jgi:DNA-binding NarL/FixJ family response regulator
VTNNKTSEETLLAPRQFQVAKMLAVGKTNREIADELEINVKTVDSHRGAILNRLGLRNNAELARHALRAGWVTL